MAKLEGGMFTTVLVGILAAFVSNELINQLDFGTDTFGSAILNLVPGLIGIVVVIALMSDVDA